jgi:hypothetical protein
MASTPVYLEVGRTRVFAVMVDWPGWARSGRTTPAALEALTAYQGRYARVAARAGYPLPDDVAADLAVVEELAGDATTEFGAPGRVPDLDRAALTGEDARRLADLVAASWAELDEVAAGAPAQLRKGPRGGGRDRDDVMRHVLAAETSYARKIGVRMREPQVGDLEAIAAFRAQVRRALQAGDLARPATGWPIRYAARRIGWHVLDHAWEIEDRSLP